MPDTCFHGWHGAGRMAGRLDRWLDGQTGAADASGEEKGEVPTAKQETWQRVGSAPDPPNL